MYLLDDTLVGIKTENSQKTLRSKNKHLQYCNGFEAFLGKRGNKCTLGGAEEEIVTKKRLQAR
jgi:hypothetical protein